MGRQGREGRGGGEEAVAACLGTCLQQQVVGLGDVHILLLDARRERGLLDELRQRPRPVDHLEAARLVGAELRQPHRGHEVHQRVGRVAGEQAGEAGHLGAGAGLALRTAEVVVEDARLPLLIQAALRRQDRVVRPPTRRATRRVGLHALHPRQVIRVGPLGVRHGQPVRRAIEQLLCAQRRSWVVARDIGRRRIYDQRRCSFGRGRAAVAELPCLSGHSSCLGRLGCRRGWR